MDQKPNLHVKTIGLILGIDPLTITKKEPKVPKLGLPYYDLGKRIRHAGHNGMRAFRLASYIHQSVSWCEMLMNKFHETNPKIQKVFHEGIRSFVRQYRSLTCPNGRRRDFFSRLDDKLYQEAISYIQQATVSDLTKFTMHRIAGALPGYMTKYKFLTEQHDGILTEVHKDMTEQYANAFKACYERKINFNQCSLSRDFELIIPVEVSMSDTNWMDLHEIEI